MKLDFPFEEEREWGCELTAGIDHQCRIPTFASDVPPTFHCRTPTRECNNREFPPPARGGLEAMVQPLGLSQLTDVPQQKRRERSNQEPGSATAPDSATKTRTETTHQQETG